MWFLKSIPPADPPLGLSPLPLKGVKGSHLLVKRSLYLSLLTTSLGALGLLPAGATDLPELIDVANPATPESLIHSEIYSEIHSEIVAADLEKPVNLEKPVEPEKLEKLIKELALTQPPAEAPASSASAASVSEPLPLLTEPGSELDNDLERSPTEAIAPATPAPTPTPILGQAEETPAPIDAPTESAPTETESPAAENAEVASDGLIRLEVSPAEDPRVPADGRSTLTIQGQIVNERGEPIPQDLVVTLTASAGQFVGADQDRDRPGFQVLATQGQFTAQLQSTLEAQKVRIRAAIDSTDFPPSLSTPHSSPLTPHPSHTEGLEAYTQVEFITNLRPSIATGVINLRLGKAGTDFYGSLRDFLNPDTLDRGNELDIGAAVFATGQIGEWLFTGAYNSDRPLNEDCDGTTRLFREPQFCEKTYPVYGDSSTIDYLTPSIDSVYVRFERTSPVPGAEPDYGMWGDYRTREFARASQLFTATDRNLHGLKANYSFGNLQVTAFYGNNVQGFQRDAIAPNGTSGYYFLSRRFVLPGSENVFLETEELNRPGTVIERRPLNRGRDYEIDYDRGTLLFRRPILATEFDPFGLTLVRRIVTTYQFEGTGDETQIYAGRVQYNFSQAFTQESWAALSYLREDQGSQDFELYGLDFFVPVGQLGRLVGEVARSNSDSLFFGDISGSAYRLEFAGELGGDRSSPTSHSSPLTPPFYSTPRSSPLSYRLYYRSVDETFANNATFSFTPGQTRYGGAIATRVSPTTQLQFQYDHETNYGFAPLVRQGFTDLFNPAPEAIPGSQLDNSLTTISAGVYQKVGPADLSLAYVNRSREDRIAPGFLNQDSSQLVSRLALALANNLTFRAQNELNLGNASDPLYPDRTTLGVDWAAYPGVTVRLAHQFFSGGQFTNNSITSLDTILDHRLTEDTTLTGRYSIIGGASGMTSQGAVGLNHRWTLAPGLRLNLGYERIFGDVFAFTAAGQQFAQPYAVGQSAASLGLTSGDSYSVGLEYTDHPDFKASARFEQRNSSQGNNTVISAAALGKISPAVTALVRYQQANYANQLVSGLLGDTTNLKVGLAYRNPFSDRWNALLKYEYRQNPALVPNTLLFGGGTGSSDHVLSMEGIYTPNWRWEFYGKYALRSSTSYLTNESINSSTVSLAQARVSYQLGFNTDLAGEVRWISQPSVNYSETAFVVEAGYYLTPNLRLAAGYSFGGVDDRDLTGYRSKGGPYIGLSLKLNELFSGFGLQKVAPPQQRESEVKPVAGNNL